MRRDSEWKVAIIIGIMLLSFCLGLRWYKSGLQSEVCKRQGIEMSRWEIFMGIRPIERSVIIKKDKTNE